MQLKLLILALFLLALPLHAEEPAKPVLSEVQQLRGKNYLDRRDSLGARFEKAQNDAKRAADERLKRDLDAIQQTFQAEVQQLEKERLALEGDYAATVKPEPGATFDWTLDQKTGDPGRFVVAAASKTEEKKK